LNKKIIWISSFPKSGNTYLRCFLAHYLFGSNKEFDFKIIKNINKFETKHVFNKVMNASSISTTQFTHYKYFLDVQRKLIEKYDQNKLIFKTHHFFGEVDNYKFTSNETTLLFIYLIRDPREVLVSYANHNNINTKEIIESFISEDSILKFEMDSLINWRLHYKSWKSFRSVPSIFIKYEDLIDNPSKILGNLLNFLSRYINIQMNQKKFNRSVEFTKFDNLQKLEIEKGFKEAQENRFFNSGKKDTWKNILSTNDINKIEKAFKTEMQELGYL